MGPAIDVGYAMNSKVLKNNGEVFPLSTLSTLSIEETDNTDLKEQHLKFDGSVIANLGDTTTETDLPDKDSTPTYDTYVNDMTEGTLDAPDKDLEPTPEAGDKYVNTDVMLPRGGTLLRGRVIECKLDRNTMTLTARSRRRRNAKGGGPKPNQSRYIPDTHPNRKRRGGSSIIAIPSETYWRRGHVTLAAHPIEILAVRKTDGEIWKRGDR